jgi:hypothetical protein
MRISPLAAAGLGAALLVGMPAQGQMASPMAQGTGSSDAPRSTAPSDVLRHSREQAVPPAGRSPGSTSAMNQAARRADAAVAVREPGRLLEEAGRAVDAGNWVLANELVERAQTTLLNEHVQSGGGGAIGGSPEALRAVSEAGAAVNSRNRSRARTAINEARTIIARAGDAPGMAGSQPTAAGARPGAGMTTGATGGPAMSPGAGGGATMSPGTGGAAKAMPPASPPQR